MLGYSNASSSVAKKTAEAMEVGERLHKEALGAITETKSSI